MSFLRVLMIVAVGMVVSSCLELTHHYTINPNGSGTLRVTWKQLLGERGRNNSQQKIPFEYEKLKKACVGFKSFSDVTVEKSDGSITYVFTAAFDDINKVRTIVPGGWKDLVKTRIDAVKPGPHTTFKFQTQNDVTTLTVTNPMTHYIRESKAFRMIADGKYLNDSDDAKTERFDENGDGKVDDDEINKVAEAMLKRLEARGSGTLKPHDKNGDGVLDDVERTAALSAIKMRLCGEKNVDSETLAYTAMAFDYRSWKKLMLKEVYEMTGPHTLKEPQREFVIQARDVLNETCLLGRLLFPGQGGSATPKTRAMSKTAQPEFIKALTAYNTARGRETGRTFEQSMLTNLPNTFMNEQLFNVKNLKKLKEVGDTRVIVFK